MCPINDKAFTYLYDANGNLIYDEYKQMYVYYNHLNLPDSIVFREKGKIINQYLADGTLLERREIDSEGKLLSKTNYEGLFLFKNDTLHYIFTAEGYLDKNLSYHYIVKDHLGNTRNISDAKGNTIQQNAYYPFGKRIKELDINPNYEFTYNSKEEINSFGANMLDYWARNYDNELGIWRKIDPKAENYVKVSPYSYAVNNPILMIDPDGEDVYIYYVGPQRKGLNYPVYYFLGHTAIGAKPSGSKRTWYHPTSGNIAEKVYFETAEPYFGYSSAYDEPSTILEYARSGEVIIKMRISLSPDVEKIIASYAANAVNGRDLGGAYCTKKVRNILFYSFKEAGYSDKEARKAVKKMLWYGTPEYPTGKELLDAGFSGFELFYQDENEQVKRIDVDFGTNNENSDQKAEQLNDMLNDFSDLEEGTYTWNGTEWVRQ